MLKEMARKSVGQMLTGRAGGPNRLVFGVIAATSAAWALSACKQETIDLLPPSDSSQAGQSAGNQPPTGGGGTGGYGYPSSTGGVSESPWWTGGSDGRGGSPTQPPGAGGSPSPGTVGSDCTDSHNCLPGLVCHPFFRECEPACETNEDCDDYRRPFCDRESGSSGLCVQCLTNTDCAWADPERPICLPFTKFCAECSTDGDCEAPNAYCDLSIFTCRRCLDDTHCPQDMHCDPLYFQCQECVTDEHCPEQTYCDGLFVCRECLINEHCPEQYYCDLSSHECVSW